MYPIAGDVRARIWIPSKSDVCSQRCLRGASDGEDERTFQKGMELLRVSASGRDLDFVSVGYSRA
jgi:hypothetical protein